MANTIKDALEELPPRARRIPFFNLGYWHDLGTTSACAENTPVFAKVALSDWNYLRVRGEYSSQITGTITLMELPPRARRIPVRGSSSQLFMGTTSACAENTHPEQFARTPRRNYLRVRGEYPK